jgi:hypothetical protein
MQRQTEPLLPPFVPCEVGFDAGWAGGSGVVNLSAQPLPSDGPAEQPGEGRQCWDNLGNCQRGVTLAFIR